MSTPTSRTSATFVSPIVESRRWLEGYIPTQPLIDVSQAAPADLPPLSLRQELARAAVEDADAHLYGAVLGRPGLRAALATQMIEHYGGTISAKQIAITAGCNQAFAAAISATCTEGDEILLPTPWYFNHKMWLDMQGVTTVPLKTNATMLPDPDVAATLITPRTRAIVLVTPNNPCGAEYPDTLLERYFELAQTHGITLILDETYRDFDSRDGAPHRLFQREDWGKVLIHLYSFSKSFRLTGHRVGAIAAAPSRLLEIEKFLDTVAICPAQLGQIAAQWGLENLTSWLTLQRTEILHRRAAIETGFTRLAAKGWKLLGLGAYFAYVQHPFSQNSQDLARKMVQDIDVLMLPGTMFVPEGDPDGPRQFRMAFANVDCNGIAELFKRLETYTP